MSVEDPKVLSPFVNEKILDVARTVEEPLVEKTTSLFAKTDEVGVTKRFPLPVPPLVEVAKVEHVTVPVAEMAVTPCVPHDDPANPLTFPLPSPT